MPANPTGHCSKPSLRPKTRRAANVGNLKVHHSIAPASHDERSPTLGPVADPRAASEHQGGALACSYPLLCHVAAPTVSRYSRRSAEGRLGKVNPDRETGTSVRTEQAARVSPRNMVPRWSNSDASWWRVRQIDTSRVPGEAPHHSGSTTRSSNTLRYPSVCVLAVSGNS